MVRCQSELVSVVLLVAVAIAALAVASNIIISDFLRARQPKGELMDLHVSVEGELVGGLRCLKVSILVSCSGPNCDRYTVSSLRFWGVERTTYNQMDLHTDDVNKRLRSGVTRIDSLVYYDASRRYDELVISITIVRPDGTRETLIKSVTIG